MKSFEIMEALTEINDELIFQTEEDTHRSKRSKRKSGSARWLGRVAAVAAVIMLMTVSVFAAGDIAETIADEGNKIVSFFGSVYNDKKAEIVDDIGKDYQSSSSEGDTAVTPILMIADEHHLYIHIRVTVQEGQVLRDITKDDYKYYANISICTKSQSIGSGGQCGYALQAVTALPDDDSTDNVKEFVFDINSWGSMEFNDGARRTLTISNLTLHGTDCGYECTTGKHTTAKCTRILTEEYEIDIKLDKNDVNMEINAGGISFVNDEHDFTVTVNQFTVTPLSITFDWNYTMPEDPDICPGAGGEFEVFMKDGSSYKNKGYIRLSDHGFDPETDIIPGDTYCFPEPIVLEDIDYIIFGGEYIFDVN